MERVSNSQFFARGFVLWLIFMMLAVADGFFRDLVLVPLFGNWVALFTSGVIMVLIFYGGAYLFIRFTETPEDPKTLLLLGLMWSGLTFFFEALMGFMVRGLSVMEFLALYHPGDLLVKGETITFGLVLVIFAPLVCHHLAKRHKK